MRKISTHQIQEAVRKLCLDTNINLNPDVINALKYSYEMEQQPIAKDILKTIISNADIAAARGKPLCQDTGIGIFFINIGQEVIITDGDITECISKAMSEVYTQQPFRFSIVKDPLFNRVNTNNNLPPLIHWEIVSGDSMEIFFLPKGGGAENMSRVHMFNPLSSIDDIKNFVVETVRVAGGKPCPPLIIGIGIGGSFDYAPLLAKKSLLISISKCNKDDKWAEVEHDLLTQINNLGIGPMGLGGNTTALSVKILTSPCHIASLPVAVNIQCHSHRVNKVLL